MFSNVTCSAIFVQAYANSPETAHRESWELFPNHFRTLAPYGVQAPPARWRCYNKTTLLNHVVL